MCKRRSIKKQTFLFFLFSTLPLFFTSILSANTLPVHVQIVDNGDDGDDGNDQPWLIAGSTVPINFRIRLTNLYSLSESSPYYVLPPGTPDILFRCSFGVETFDFYPNLFTVADDIEADQTVYEWKITVNVSMLTNCQVYPEYITKTTKILDTAGNTYPIGAHSSIGDIFSCGVFSETLFCCDNNCPSDESMSVNEYTYYITCDDSGGAEPYSNDDGDFEEEDIFPYVVQNVPDVIGIYPNPCRGNTTLEVELTESSVVELTIYNTSGQLIWQQAATSEKGLYQKEIDTETWLPGVYIGHLKYGDQQKAFRLSKL